MHVWRDVGLRVCVKKIKKHMFAHRNFAYDKRRGIPIFFIRRNNKPQLIRVIRRRN